MDWVSVTRCWHSEESQTSGFGFRTTAQNLLQPRCSVEDSPQVHFGLHESLSRTNGGAIFSSSAETGRNPTGYDITPKAGNKATVSQFVTEVHTWISDSLLKQEHRHKTGCNFQYRYLKKPPLLHTSQPIHPTHLTQLVNQTKLFSPSLSMSVWLRKLPYFDAVMCNSSTLLFWVPFSSILNGSLLGFVAVFFVITVV